MPGRSTCCAGSPATRHSARPDRGDDRPDVPPTAVLIELGTSPISRLGPDLGSAVSGQGACDPPDLALVAIAQAAVRARPMDSSSASSHR
jgi:hypothetical protein